MGHLGVEVPAWWERGCAVNEKCQLKAYGTRRRE